MWQSPGPWPDSKCSKTVEARSSALTGSFPEIAEDSKGFSTLRLLKHDAQLANAVTTKPQEIYQKQTI